MQGVGFVNLVLNVISVFIQFVENGFEIIDKGNNFEEYYQCCCGDEGWVFIEWCFWFIGCVSSWCQQQGGSDNCVMYDFLFFFKCSFYSVCNVGFVSFGVEFVKDDFCCFVGNGFDIFYGFCV